MKRIGGRIKMANKGLTHIWAHGTSIQYNIKDADPKNIEVLYTPNGFELKKTPSEDEIGSNQIFNPTVITVFLPITLPTAISDAIQHFSSLILQYRTKGSGAKINNIRLVRNNVTVFSVGNLNTDLDDDFITNGGRVFGTLNNPYIPIGESLCVEITIVFQEIPREVDPRHPNPVIIAGAEIISEQKKFDYN